jgi:thioredoxin 1
LKNAGEGKLVIVDFSAEWCGPCKMIAPTFEALSKEHADVVFIHVDVDVLEDLPDGSDVRGVPTFKFFKDGNLLDTFSGANKDKLSSNLAKFK